MADSLDSVEGDDVGDLGSRLLKSLRAHDRGADEIEGVLSVELQHISRCPDKQTKLEALVTKLSESQSALRGRHSQALSCFCLALLELLGSSRRHQWSTQLAGLRLLEGVLLVRPPADEYGRRTFCWTVQSLLKSFLPRLATVRLESAMMSLSCSEVRSICAPDQSPVVDGTEFSELAASFRPSSETTSNLREAYNAFDEVIFKTFSVHGQRFGSTVNGFQLQSSDLDIVVLLPSEVKQTLVEKAKERKRASAEAGANGAGECAEDWDFASSGRLVKVASTMAARDLAQAFSKAGLKVVEVVEQARVPIVKCKHTVKTGSGASIDVDISFCNEVAYHNSRLLRVYSEFDERVQSLVVLVKLWAKRRLLNSALEGTLSSYAYSLMVIHFLQARGILPNLQHPRGEVLQESKCSVQEKLIEGGHNVWYLQPPVLPSSASVSAGRSTVVPEEARIWLGADPPGDSLAELLYGFFRYFALEFNLYADVVSIRLPGRASKVDYFAAMRRQQAEGSDGGDASDAGDVEAQGVAEAEESVVRDVAELEGAKGDDEDSDDEADEEVVFPVVAAPADESVPLPSEPAALGPSREDVSSPAGHDAPEPERFAGVLANYEEQTGWGVISTAGAGNPASIAREVLVPRKEVERSGVAPSASCTFSLETGARGKPQACDVRLGSALGGRSSSSPASAPPGVLGPKSQAASPVPAPISVPSAGPKIQAASPEPGQIFEGTVKSFHPEHGWGFVACEGTEKQFGRDVFLHQNQNQGFTVGDRVRFSVELNHKSQPQARQVRKVGHSEPHEEDSARATTGDKGLHADAPAAPASEMLCPMLSHEEYSVDRQLKNRQCWCIDDPMEKSRTLGPTFGGQELISKEMRRALSIFKRGGAGVAQELLGEKDSRSVKRQAWSRDLSPVPEITRTGLRVEREVRKEWCGKIIGKGGCVATRIKQEFGLEEFRIKELPRGSFLHYSGPPGSVVAAMGRVEEIVAGPHSRAEGHVAAQTRSHKSRSAEQIIARDSRAQARSHKNAKAGVSYYAGPASSAAPSAAPSTVPNVAPSAGRLGTPGWFPVADRGNGIQSPAAPEAAKPAKSKNKISSNWQ